VDLAIKVMAKPISLDLRRRVVEAYKSDEGTMQKLATRFCLGINTVCRWVQLDLVYRDLSPRPHGGGVPPKITYNQFPELRALVAEKPDRTLVDLAVEWGRRTGQLVHASSMGRALARAGLSRKKNFSRS
jgi:transposase